MMVVLAIVAAVSLLGFVALAAVVYQLVGQHGSLLYRLEALETRLGSLEQASSVATAQEAQGLAAGSSFGGFRLPDFGGTLQDLQELPGRRLLVHWSPHCGFCDLIASELAEHDQELRRQGVRLALVSWGNVEDNRRFATEHGLECPILLQDGSPPVEAFAGLGTPVAYLIDAQGQTELAAAIGAESVLELARELAQGRRRLAGERPTSMSRIERNGLKAGTAAPAFALPDLDGQERVLSDFRGRELLLVFSDPECGPCNALAPELAALHHVHADAFALVMVSRGSREDNRVKVSEHGIPFPVLLQPGWRLSKQYGIFETPVAFRIDEGGVIAAPLARGRDQILALAAAMAHHKEPRPAVLAKA